MQENKITSSVIIHKPHVTEEGQVKIQSHMTTQLQTLKITTFQGDRKAQ